MTITAPGYYRLTKNIFSSAMTGNIITIQQHNVTIDFNSFYIVGPNNVASNLTGIRASEFGNLTIKNGSIAFCRDGIVLTGNGNPATTRNINHIIDNMRITNTYEYGVYFPTESPGSVVSNCQLSQIGGTTAASTFYGIGLYALGTGILFKDNIINNVTGPASASTMSYGIATIGISVRNAVSNCHYGVYTGKYQNNLTQNTTTPFTPGTDAGGNN